MLYCCEVCGKKHTSEEKALECERVHEEEKARREELAKNEEGWIKEIEDAYENLMDLIKAYREEYNETIEIEIIITKGTFPVKTDTKIQMKL